MDRFFRRASVGLAVVAALALTACDDPPTADHPLVHRYVATLYDGRPLPTTLCPNDDIYNLFLDSLTLVINARGDSATETTMTSVMKGGAPIPFVRTFRFAVRDGEMVLIDWQGHETGVYGTIGPRGIDASFASIRCAFLDGSMEHLTPSIRFEPSY